MGMKMFNLFIKLLPLIWAVLLGVLTVSGFAQMPIFKRYYIADLPGLAWTADYYFTHKMHYMGGALLMALAAWMAIRWTLEAGRDWQITGSGWLRIGLLLGIIGTGALRMYKNQPGASFTPEFTLVVDWIHLGLVLVLGLTALALRFFGKGRYAMRRARMAELGN